MDELFERRVVEPKDYKSFWVNYWYRVPELRTMLIEDYLDTTREMEPKKLFSGTYELFSDWLEAPIVRTTPYQRRIQRFMLKHPAASLKAARGHR